MVSILAGEVLNELDVDAGDFVDAVFRGFRTGPERSERRPAHRDK